MANVIPIETYEKLYRTFLLQVSVSEARVIVHARITDKATRRAFEAATRTASHAEIVTIAAHQLALLRVAADSPSFHTFDQRRAAELRRALLIMTRAAEEAEQFRLERDDDTEERDGE